MSGEESGSPQSKVLMPRGISGTEGQDKRRKESARPCLELVILVQRLDRKASKWKPVAEGRYNGSGTSQSLK